MFFQKRTLIILFNPVKMNFHLRESLCLSPFNSIIIRNKIE